MSFLYDKKIYEEILKQAQIAPSPFAPNPNNLTAPSGTANPNAVNPNVVAKKLVNNLSRELTNTPQPPNISTVGDVDLKVENLTNLGNLLKFMSSTKMSISGKRIAYTGEENKNLPPEVEKDLYPISVNVSRDVSTRKWNADDYYVNFDLLVPYISYLQQKANSMKNAGDDQGKVLQVLVGKLIDQVNEAKPNSGLNRKPKSTPDKPSELPDTDVLDRFGSKVFDPKDPMKDTGSIPLLVGHLKSKATLNEWMQQGPEAQVAVYDDKNQRTLTKYTDPRVNFCNMVSTLYARAKYWSQIAKSEDESKRFSFYLHRIQELGPLFEDPSGKACVIGAVSNMGNNTVNNNGKGTGTGTGKTNANQQQVMRVVSSLPLRVQYLDFDKIQQFFQEYKQIMPPSSQVTQNMSDAIAAMDDVQDHVISPTRNINLMASPQELKTLLRPPQGQHFIPFVQNLEKIISNTGAVLRDLQSKFADEASGEAMISDSTSLSRINAQIGPVGSIYDSNWRQVKTWENQFSQIRPIGK